MIATRKNAIEKNLVQQCVITNKLSTFLGCRADLNETHGNEYMQRVQAVKNAAFQFLLSQSKLRSTSVASQRTRLKPKIKREDHIELTF